MRMYLQAVTAIRFTVNHFNDVVVYLFTLGITMRPIITGTTTAIVFKDVFWVVKVGIGGGKDVVDDLCSGYETNGTSEPFSTLPTLGSKSSRMARGT